MADLDTRYRIYADKMAIRQRCDKAVQVEMKNRIETARLRTVKKFYDRQCAIKEWQIEKQKRQAVNAQKKMSHSSGISQESRQPDGPGDRNYEKSLYFRGKSTLNLKRLQQWRLTEKHLEKTLSNVGDIRSAEKTTAGVAKKRLGPMMRQLGYDAEDDLVEGVANLNTGEQQPEVAKLSTGKTSHKAFISRISVKMSPARSPGPSSHSIDVFKCLHGSQASSGGLPERSTESETEAERHTPVFSARQWEKRYIVDYLEYISTSVVETQKEDNGRSKSASARFWASEWGKNKNWDKETVPTKLENTKSRREMDGGRSPLVRRKLGRKGKKKASSDSIGIKCTNVRPHSVHVVGRKEQSSEVRAASAGISRSLDQQLVSNGTETYNVERQLEYDPDSDKGMPSPRRPTVRTNMPSPNNGAERDNTETDESGGTSYVINNFEKEVSSPHRVSKNRLGSIADTTVDTPPGMDDRGHTSPNVHFKHQHVQQEHTKSEHNSLGGGKLGSDQNAWDDMEARPPHHHRPQAVPNHEHDLAPSDHLFLGRRVSRWRRDLMVEAPPSIFTSKEPVKVAVVMSKSQRRRELDKLVDDHRADAKRIVWDEQTRRLQSRLNVFLTVSKVDEAASLAGKVN